MDTSLTSGHRQRPTSRLVLGLALVAGLLLLGVPAPAFAEGEPPEAPATEPCTSPVPQQYEMCGKLNPNRSAKVRYYFAYNKGTSCEGGSRTQTEPEVEGQGIEVVSNNERLVLYPGTEYTYCLVATNAYGATPGLPGLMFETAASREDPPEPQTEACPGAPLVGRMRLCGTLNLNYWAWVGYYFAYAQGAGCAGGSRTVEHAEVEGRALPVSSEVTGLEPSTLYTYCLVATDNPGPGQFEETVGQPLSFTTPGERPTVADRKALVAGPTEATLQAQIDPNNQATSYSFAYSINAALADASTTPVGDIPAGLQGQAVSAPASGLAPDTTYYYRAVASNGTGTSEGPIESFATAALPPQGPPSTAEKSTGPSTTTLTAVLSPPPGVVSPAPPPKLTPKPKGLTIAQKRARALHACRMKPRKQRSSCERRAERKYGATAHERQGKQSRRAGEKK
jgi:hypothetical protein